MQTLETRQGREDGTPAAFLRREDTRVFFLSLLLMLAAFAVMLPQRVSNDGYSVYFEQMDITNILWKLKAGRYGGAAAEAVVHYLGLSTITAQLPFTLALIACAAWCCAKLWALVTASFQNPGRCEKALVWLFILPTFVNISVGEFFFFSECGMHWIGMLLPAQLALGSFFAGDDARHRLRAFLWLLLSLSFYQASIGYFVVWGLLIALLRGELRADRKTVSALLWVLAVGAAAGLAIVAVQRLMELAGLTAGTERSPGVRNIWDNFLLLATQWQRYVLADGMHFLGPAMGAAAALLAAGLVLSCAGAGLSAASFCLTLAAALAAYGVSYAPHLLSGKIWLAPRTMFSLFSWFSFCGVLIVYLGRGRRLLPYAAAAVIALFLLANVRGIWTIGLEQIRSNAEDRRQALAILERIEDYERAQGVSVDKLGYVRDSLPTYNNPEAPHAFMDINIRAGAIDWEIPRILEYYGNRRFELTDVPDEIVKAHFEGKEWSAFDPDEQVVLDGNAVYLGIY